MAQTRFRRQEQNRVVRQLANIREVHRNRHRICNGKLVPRNHAENVKAKLRGVVWCTSTYHAVIYLSTDAVGRLALSLVPNKNVRLQHGMRRSERWDNSGGIAFS